MKIYTEEQEVRMNRLHNLQLLFLRWGSNAGISTIPNHSFRQETVKSQLPESFDNKRIALIQYILYMN